MKMLIVGDSYSTNYSDLSWPAIVDKHFDCTSINLSRPASSLNYSYNLLTRELKTTHYDVVIFALTSSDRLYHKDYLIHGGFPQHHDGTPVNDNIKKVIKDFYVHLYDIDNTHITWDIFCHGLASVSLEFPSTKFIFIPAFHEFIKINIGNCVITNSRLLDFSMLDKIAHDAEYRGVPAVRNNHLSFKQNNSLANYVIDSIENYEYNCVKFLPLTDLKNI